MNLFNGTSLLPAELQIAKVSLTKFFNILEQKKDAPMKASKNGKMPIHVNQCTHIHYFQHQKVRQMNNVSIIQRFKFDLEVE